MAAPPLHPQLSPTHTHMLRGHMSEVPRLIVMIMSVRVQRERRGWFVGERMSLEGGADGEGGRGGGSGLVQRECHVIFPVIPRLLL